jgi:hypothetical protein
VSERSGGVEMQTLTNTRAVVQMGPTFEGFADKDWSSLLYVSVVLLSYMR